MVFRKSLKRAFRKGVLCYYTTRGTDIGGGGHVLGEHHLPTLVPHSTCSVKTSVTLAICPGGGVPMCYLEANVVDKPVMGAGSGVDRDKMWMVTL